MISADGFACACPKCGSSELQKRGTRRNKSGDVQKYSCNECGWQGSGVEYADEAVIDEAAKQARKAQRYQDKNRVERKAFRENTRVFNLYEDLNNKLIESLDKHKFKPLKKHKKKIKSKGVGVLHFSDLHFNELIRVGWNEYDFHIASKRLQKYIQASIREFKADGVGRVVCLFGGDLLNSDRRIDEITAACTNRTQAMVLAVEILQQCLQDVAKNWNVDVFWVCGNEGRVNQEIGFNDFVASDNYDHAIPMMLSRLFRGSGAVTFHMPQSAMECVIKINGKTFVLLHGHGGGKGAPTAKAAQVRAKYAERGVTVDYVVWGHIHEAYISELFARSGSPAGGNAFSDKALGLGGKPSLNNYKVSASGEISGSVVPLVDISDYQGYDFDEDLVSYNSKSEAKTKSKHVVFEVVV